MAKGWTILDYRPPKLLVIIAALGLIALVGIVDLTTGNEISVALFYMIPILAATWYLGLAGGFSFSVVSLATIILIDYAVQPTSMRTLVFFWNNLGIFCFYMVVSLLAARLRLSLSREKEMSRTDSLTGIANSRFFYEETGRELLRSRRYGHPLTVIFIDCDDFKSINDYNGHAAGDDLLIVIATTIAANIRQSDLVARLGGDEFCIVMPETGAELSLAKVMLLRDRLLAGTAERGWPVTFSIGLVTFMRPPATVEELVHRADSLMYEVKRQGKNNIKQAFIAD